MLALKVVDSERAAEEAALLAKAVGATEAVVERATRGPWRPRVRPEELRAVEAVGQRVAQALEAAGVRVRRPLAVRGDAWYGEGRPGWRQRLTGLVRPSEGDVYRLLKGLERSGNLVGPVPRHPGLVDAIGMALS